MKFRPRITALALLVALIVSGGVLVLHRTWFSEGQSNQSKPIHVGKRAKQTAYCIYINSPNEC